MGNRVAMFLTHHVGSNNRNVIYFRNLGKINTLHSFILINQRTSGPVNAHLISWPSKAQNIQNLENFHKKFGSVQQSSS